MGNRLKIAIFEPKFLLHPSVAGPHTTLIKRQAEFFSESGHEVVIITEDINNKQMMESREDYAIYKIRGILSCLSRFFFTPTIYVPTFSEGFAPSIIFKTIEVLKKEPHIDVIYSSGTPIPGVVSNALISQKSGIPSVYYFFYSFKSSRWWTADMPIVGGIPSRYVIGQFFRMALRELLRRKSFLRWGLRHINRIIASSVYVKRNIQEIEPPLKKINVVYPSVTIPSEKVIKKEQDNLIITYFGHLRFDRGVIDVLKAFLTVIKIYPNVKLMIAPSNIHNPTKMVLKRLIFEHNLGKYIIWKGKVRDVYSDILLPSSIIVLPHYDAPSIKLIEAMAASKPVITTNLEWTCEIISHGFNGYLIKPGDISGIAEGISTLLDNPDLRESMGKKARETVKLKCSLERTCNSILDVLKET